MDSNVKVLNEETNGKIYERFLELDEVIGVVLR